MSYLSLVLYYRERGYDADQAHLFAIHDRRCKSA